MLGFGVYSQQALSDIRAITDTYVLANPVTWAAEIASVETRANSDYTLVGVEFDSNIGILATESDANYTLDGVSLQAIISDATVWGPLPTPTSAWTPVSTASSTWISISTPTSSWQSIVTGTEDPE